MSDVYRDAKIATLTKERDDALERVACLEKELKALRKPKAPAPELDGGTANILPLLLVAAGLAVAAWIFVWRG